MFYGWRVLAAAFAVLFLIQGSRAIVGVTFKPIIDEFLWHRGSVSLAVFLNMTVFALMLPLAGKCYDRYGARRVIFASGILVAAGFTGVTLVKTLPGFLFFYGIVAAIGFGGTSIPLFAALIGRWFDTHRGFAISMALAGGSIGHFVVVLFSTYAVIGYNWRSAFLVCGILIFLVSTSMAGLVIRNRPGDIGLAPYRGKKTALPATGAPPHTEATNAENLSLREAMRTSSFWLFTMVMFICGGGDYLVLTHLVPMVTDVGIPASSAGRMLAWFGLASFAGVLVAGWMADRLGNKIPIVGTFIFRGLLFLLVLRHQDPLSFYIFALGFGFTHLITAPITTTLIARLYGFASMGVISGLITTIHHVGGGLWAWWGGVAFDLTGSYYTVLLAYAAASFTAAACGMLIRDRHHFRPFSSRRHRKNA